MSNSIARITAALDRFLFDSCDPLVCAWMRVAYAVLLLIWTSILMLDAGHWLSDEGVLRSTTAQQLTVIPQWSLLFFLPSTNEVATLVLSLLLAHTVMLLIGVYSRWQMVFIFVWLTSIQHRNPLICDGEDTLFRLLAFMMIFMPLDYAYSLSRWVHGRRRPRREEIRREEIQGSQPAEDTDASDMVVPRYTAWALRLVQFEITAIYLSTAWSKWQGASWRDGSALYYVSRMDDAFGRLWLPEFLFETPELIRLMTWSVLAIETLLPVALWLPATRKHAIVAGVLLHLAIEYSMHLFLFEWIMIVGLMSFMQPSQWSLLHKIKRLRSSSSQIGSSFSST